MTTQSGYLGERRCLKLLRPDTPMESYFLGRIAYTDAWRLQRELVEARIEGRIGDVLLLLEHPPTITLGRGADRRHLLADETALDRLGVTVVDTDRGGDITFHGPGQLVGYPIVNLVDHRTDIDWYLRTVEAVLIEACGVFGLHARRFPPHTGVWVGDRKIAAIGVKVRRWVTSHGFAMNVRDLSAWFGLIVPCGLAEYGVTSVEQELGRTIPESDVRLAVAGLMEARFASAGSGPPGSSAGISRIIGEILPKRLDSPSGAAL